MLLKCKVAVLLGFTLRMSLLTLMSSCLNWPEKKYDGGDVLDTCITA